MYLPDLQMLHLRQSNMVMVDALNNTDSHNGAAFTFALQSAANAIFDRVQSFGWCPNLKALVLGSNVPTPPPENGMLEEEKMYIPQHCFIKGFQTDIMGRTTAVGVPVSKAVLRHVSPFADILDFDQERARQFDGEA
jgi:hypothetical protein